MVPLAKRIADGDIDYGDDLPDPDTYDASDHPGRGGANGRETRARDPGDPAPQGRHHRQERAHHGIEQASDPHQERARRDAGAGPRPPSPVFIEHWYPDPGSPAGRPPNAPDC